jgi:hypothetical protein
MNLLVGKNPNEYPRPIKVLLWTCHHMDELRERGLLTGNPIVTPKGLASLDQITAEGFKPTDEEIAWAVKYIREWSERRGL